MYAAYGGKLDCLDLLIARGANLEATGPVSAALPANVPSAPFCPSPLPSPRPLFASVTTAVAPPQMGVTALFYATIHGELDCLERLIAKRANVNAADEVSAAPPAARTPPVPSPTHTALTVGHPCAAPARPLATGADRVCRRRRASAGR